MNSRTKYIYVTLQSAVFLALSANLSVAASLHPLESVNGVIWDVSADRILYEDPSKTLHILDRNTGANTVIPLAGASSPEYGYLSPSGAIFAASSNSGSVFSMVYQYQNQTLSVLENHLDSQFSLKVAGNYAIWNAYSNGSLLIERNLSTDTNLTVASNVGNWVNDVTATGVVDFWSYPGYDVHRYANGVTTSVAHDSSFWNVYVSTDGINSVYIKQDPCCANQKYQLMEATPSGEIALTPRSSFEPDQGRNFQIDNGWVAFTEADALGVQQVWLKSPNGELSQITHGQNNAQIDSLSSTGQLTYLLDGKLYVNGDSIGISGLHPDIVGGISVGSSHSFWEGNQLLISNGATLYSVSTVPEPPAISFFGYGFVLLALLLGKRFGTNMPS